MIRETPSTAEAQVTEAEQTEVRVRKPRSTPLPPSSLEYKLARARAAFNHLAGDDPRARLLQVAVLRRDEILLEALLRRLDTSPPR